MPCIGSTKSTSAQSCKHIKEDYSAFHIAPPMSGIYWVRGVQVSNYIIYLFSYLAIATIILVDFL